MDYESMALLGWRRNSLWNGERESLRERVKERESIIMNT